jgi:hypothetical protein
LPVYVNGFEALLQGPVPVSEALIMSRQLPHLRPYFFTTGVGVYLIQTWEARHCAVQMVRVTDG